MISKNEFLELLKTKIQEKDWNIIDSNKSDLSFVFELVSENTEETSYSWWFGNKAEDIISFGTIKLPSYEIEIDEMVLSE